MVRCSKRYMLCNCCSVRKSCETSKNILLLDAAVVSIQCVVCFGSDHLYSESEYGRHFSREERVGKQFFQY